MPTSSWIHRPFNFSDIIHFTWIFFFLRFFNHPALLLVQVILIVQKTRVPFFLFNELALPPEKPTAKVALVPPPKRQGQKKHLDGGASNEPDGCKQRLQIRQLLVGGFNPFEKY